MPFKCIQLVFAGNVQAQTQNTFVSEYRGKLKLKKVTVDLAQTKQLQSNLSILYFIQSYNGHSLKVILNLQWDVQFNFLSKTETAVQPRFPCHLHEVKIQLDGSLKLALHGKDVCPVIQKPQSLIQKSLSLNSKPVSISVSHKRTT